ncbi:argG [Symbiodinium sp. KB8]|nr:argG [Symbiodinium sp. KB8]
MILLICACLGLLLPWRFSATEGPLATFTELNTLGGAHGVGRVDVVENRFVGIKSRGIYETPAGTILRNAHIGLEGLTVDREVLRLRDMLSAKFADYCYNGFWFSPEMEFTLNAVEKSQERVTGCVKMRLFKGSASIVGRQSPLSLYDQVGSLLCRAAKSRSLCTYLLLPLQKLSSMDEHGGYDAADAAGFIRVNSIRLKAHTIRENNNK